LLKNRYAFLTILLENKNIKFLFFKKITKNMMSFITSISAILIAVSLLQLGNGLLNTLLSLRSEAEAFSNSMIGVIMSGYFIGFFAGTFLAVPLISRVGHIRAFALCAALISCSALLHALLVSPYWWLSLRVLNGAAIVIMYTVVESWLNRQTPAESRGRVFAIYMTVNLGSIALAQQLLRFDPDLTFFLFSIASILISLSLIPITWTRLKQPEINSVASINLFKIYKSAPVALWGSLLSGLAMGAFWGLGALYASQEGLSNNAVAIFMSLFILGGALLQFPLGRYSDRHDRRLVLSLISLFAALFAITLTFTTNYLILFFGLSVVYGGLAFAIYPVSVAHLIDHLDPDEMLAGGSGLLLLHGVGAMLGPILAGQLMEILGPSSLPAFWAFNLLVLAIIAFAYQYKREAEDPDGYTADFVPMVTTTPSALEMLSVETEGDDGDSSNATWGSNEDEALADVKS
jgi:MFS family permease